MLMEPEIEEAVDDIIESSLPIDEEKLTDDTSFYDGWHEVESLDVIEMAEVIEFKLDRDFNQDVTISDDDLEHMRTIKDIKKHIAGQLED
jgi:acyl carrier protein